MGFGAGEASKRKNGSKGLSRNFKSLEIQGVGSLSTIHFLAKTGLVLAPK